MPILDNLSKGFQAGVSSEWASKTDGQGGLTADMIDEMAYKHYPACMRNLHMALRRDKHLKHYGRLQYGLFLKVSPLDEPDVGQKLTSAPESGIINRRSPHILAEGI